MKHGRMKSCFAPAAVIRVESLRACVCVCVCFCLFVCLLKRVSTGAPELTPPSEIKRRRGARFCVYAQAEALIRVRILCR